MPETRVGPYVPLTYLEKAALDFVGAAIALEKACEFDPDMQSAFCKHVSREFETKLGELRRTSEYIQCEDVGHVKDLKVWHFEDDLPEGYPYDRMFPFSVVDIVRMLPPVTPEKP